jgi:hypothetical protein
LRPTAGAAQPVRGSGARGPVAVNVPIETPLRGPKGLADGQVRIGVADAIVG